MEHDTTDFSVPKLEAWEASLTLFLPLQLDPSESLSCFLLSFSSYLVYSLAPHPSFKDCSRMLTRSCTSLLCLETFMTLTVLRRKIKLLTMAPTSPSHPD